ncbi:MAG: apolipoprotein N-acyltransferase, partial [Quisquiliibacterium sp.]
MTPAPHKKTPDRSLPRSALATLAGVLHGQCFAQPGVSWVLQLVTLASLFVLIGGLPGRQRIIPSVLFGLGWFIGGLAWLHTSMHI